MSNNYFQFLLFWLFHSIKNNVKKNKIKKIMWKIEIIDDSSERIVKKFAHFLVIRSTFQKSATQVPVILGPRDYLAHSLLQGTQWFLGVFGYYALMRILGWESVLWFICFFSCSLGDQVLGDFPGGPVVEIPYFHCRGRGFDPWLGN